jgi:alpha-tubulin suppressor-like RCC1 family protein
VKTTGSLWAWGANTTGGLGTNNTTASFYAAVQVGSLTNWSQASAGDNFSLAVKTDGTFWSWGSNSSGQLGQGNVILRSSPVQIGALTNWVQCSAAGTGSLARKTTGAMESFGGNYAGKLGLGDAVNRSSPVQIGALTSWSFVSMGSGTGLAISQGVTN